MSTYALYRNRGFRTVERVGGCFAESLKEAAYKLQADDADAIRCLNTGDAFAVSTWYDEDAQDEIDYSFELINLEES